MRSSLSLLRLLVIVAFVALLGKPCWAQAGLPMMSDTTATPVPGVGHDYIHAPLETVNPANGSVSIRIPVQLPPARGLNIPFSIAYDSNGSFYFGQDSNGYLGLHAVTGVNGVPFTSGGWSYSVPMLTFQTVNWSQTYFDNPNKSYTCTGSQNYVFQDPEGNRHGLNLATGPTHMPGGNSPADTCYFGRTTGGEGGILATTTIPAWANDGPPVTVTSADGTTYNFDTVPAYNTQTSIYVPSTIVDRNGNSVSLSVASSFNSTSASATYSDTAGRIALSIGSFGTSADAITVSGLAQGYTVVWGKSLAPSYTIQTHDWGMPASTACATQMSTNPTNTMVVSEIDLPNGQKFTFDYAHNDQAGSSPADNPYGMLTRITYPSGGYVRYVWGLNHFAESGQWSSDRVICSLALSATCSEPTYWNCEYDVPAVTDRYVSLDGTTEVLHQHFVYSTQMPQQVSTAWTSKQTTVTTTDLVRNTSFDTVYSYVPKAPDPNPSAIPWQGDLSSYNTNSQIPVESSVQYYKDTTDQNPIRTETKTWQGFRELCMDQTTLADTAPNQTGTAWYVYNSSEEETERDLLDYGVTPSGGVACQQGVSNPTRKTVTNYQSFTPHIVDKPSSVVSYDSTGARVGETDYAYDQTAATPPSGGTPTGFTSSGNFGNLTTKTVITGAGTSLISKYTYDTTGQVLTSVDPANNTTQYFYTDNFSSGGSPSGTTNAFVTRIQHPDGEIDQFSYDYAKGKLTSHTDPNTQTTSFAYGDPMARLTGITYPDGGSESVTYTDTPGSVSMLVQRKIDASRFTYSLDMYNGLLLPIAHSAANGEAVAYDRVDTCYDGLGRVRFASYPYQVGSATAAVNCSGVGDSTAYDTLSRVISVTHSDASAISTTYTGRATQVSDEGNGTSSVTRISQSDYFGDLLSVCEVTGATQQGSSGAPSACGGQDISANGFLTTYNYNGAGDLISVVRPGLANRQFTYDLASRLLTSNNPETGTVTYIYDTPDSNCSVPSHAGELVERRDARGIYTCSQYDNMNRVIGKTYTDGTPAVTFNYGESSSHGTSLTNTVGRLTSQTTGGSNPTAEVFSYDPMGRVINNSQCTPQNCASGMFSVTANYDYLGDETSFATPWYTLSQTYNIAGRLTGITSSLNDANHPANLLSGVSYSQFGSPASITMGNGIAENYTYYAQGRLHTIQAGNASTPATGSASVSGTEQSVDTGYYDEECRRWYEGGDCAQ